MPTRASIEFAQILEGTPYRAIRPLGEGGMGQVIEAEHIALKKRVVVKVVLAHLAEHPQIADRMRLEAQTLAALSGHPNLPEVSDLGQTRDGRPYIAMELLRGDTLGRVVRERGRLPVSEAVDYTLQALEGLGHAHDAGFAHRDVKLENLFLAIGPAGQPVVKVLDFGVAKVIHSTSRGPAPLMIPTEVGTQVGTPHFFSPEQALGASDVDGRADLYAMGCVFFTLLTGKRPFHTVRGPVDIARAHVERTPPKLSDVAPDGGIPGALELVVQRALAKRREDRYQTAREMADAIREAVTSKVMGTIVGTPLKLASAATEIEVPVEAEEPLPIDAPQTLGKPASTSRKREPLALRVVVISACVFAVLTTLLVFALTVSR